MKKYKIYFSTMIYGETTIEAFDEEDAREQFSVDSISDFNDERIQADIDEVVLVRETKAKKK